MNKDIQTLIEREAKKEYEEYLHGTSDIKEFLDMDDLLPLRDALKACEIATNAANAAINTALSLFKWRKVSEELPPLGEEVIFYNPDWVDEDFNPKGTRIGFRLDEDYITAYYWSHQDCYMTISHSECDDNEAYSEKTKSSIEPTEWMPIPQID